jgi:hypothetical protein
LTPPIRDGEAVDILIALGATPPGALDKCSENKIGTLEWEEADIAIWDRDFYTVPIDRSRT